MSDLSSRQELVTSRKANWAGGLTLFAGSVMVMLGFFELLEGFSAVRSDEVFVKAPKYTYALDLTAWGWIHMVIGVAAVFVGATLLTARTWALVVGMIIAVVSAISNFLFLPQNPSWSLIMIGLNVALIWAFSEVMRENRQLAHPE